MVTREMNEEQPQEKSKGYLIKSSIAKEPAAVTCVTPKQAWEGASHSRKRDHFKNNPIKRRPLSHASCGWLNRCVAP